MYFTQKLLSHKTCSESIESESPDDYRKFVVTTNKVELRSSRTKKKEVTCDAEERFNQPSTEK